MSNKKSNKNIAAGQQTPTKPAQVPEPTNVIKDPSAFPWMKFGLKILLLLGIMVGTVAYYDSKEYFVGDQKNNHVERKWRSFYKFTGRQRKKVDIAIFGNSHASAGVEPYILSSMLGVNSFILNTPGSAAIDAYFNLKEMIANNTAPKIAIIETAGLSGSEIGEEWGRIQSFEAKVGFFNRMKMTPFLFPSSDDWVKAWSPTIRNHSFLLNNKEQIEFNKANVGKEKNPDRSPLDLGRFSHGNTSMSASTLAKYDSVGYMIKCDTFSLSETNQRYIKKFADLCKEHKIQMLLYTVPVYYKIYDNYPKMQRMMNNAFKVVVPDIKLLDLQMPYDTALYNTTAFNDEFSGSQHPTYDGMMRFTYKLANYIHQNFSSLLPNRSQDQAWLADFYGSPHFLYNQPFSEGMPDIKLLLKDAVINGIVVKEALFVKSSDYNQLIIKTDKSIAATSLNTIVIINGNSNSSLPVSTPIGVKPISQNVYEASIPKDVEITGITSISY
jgi:hypothetical protein